MAQLTDSRCRNVKATGKIQKLSDGGGLYLHVTAQGQKYWRMAYRFAGKQKTYAMGVYPLISLAEAREKRIEVKKLILDGTDPALMKKIEKNRFLQGADNTFEKIAREWHSKQEGHISPNYWKEKIHRLEKDIFPKIGTFPIDQITSPILLKVIQGIEERGAREMAKRALQMCTNVFDYGIATSRCKDNPTRSFKNALLPKKSKHFASIDVHEMPQLVRDIYFNKGRLYPTTQNALKLIMLTFVRTSELIEAEWKEFDFENKVWLIPANRMKMRRDHIVPLARQTIEILQDQKFHSGNSGNDFVFPSQIHSAKSMSDGTILRALKRMGYNGRMTGHGFRSLAMTAIVEKLGYREKIPDLQLAHGEKNRVMASYNRSELLEERTKMMQEWADYIDSLR